MTPEQLAIARALEGRLRPVMAALTAASAGGTDSHGQPLRGLPIRLEAVAEQLAELARWAEQGVCQRQAGTRDHR